MTVTMTTRAESFNTNPVQNATNPYVKSKGHYIDIWACKDIIETYFTSVSDCMFTICVVLAVAASMPWNWSCCEDNPKNLLAVETLSHTT